MSYWADRIDHLTENGFPVVFAAASASCGDSPFLPLYGKHSGNVAASAELARRKNLRGLCVTSWSVHLSPKFLQYPLWELAARRYIRPGESVEGDFAEILGRRLPSVDVQTMKDVTAWIPTLAPFDSRFGICAAKWARPVAGTAKDAIERQRRDEPDYVPPSPREIEAKFVSVRKALSKLEEMSSDSRTSPFILGARLAIRHAEAIAAELDGRNPGKFPEKETERFFGLEQSASSAAVSSSLVWAPLAGNDSAGTAAK